jgi:hypothetical protein
MEIIKRSERVERTEYFQMFDRLDTPGAGLMFPCNEEGEPAPFGTEPMETSYEKAQNQEKYSPGYIREFYSSYVEAAIVRCDCGRKFDIPDFTNECPKCGALVNSFGQRLSPRSTWGEETNEHPADVERPMMGWEGW